MKVILLEDIKGVGKKDQIIDANDGYVKNFLLPKKKAVLADKGNVNKLENVKKNEEEKKKAEYEAALELCKKIENTNLIIYAKIGGNGKLFGAITNKELGSELETQANILVDRKKIHLNQPIKVLGETEAEIKLHTKVTAKLKVTVKEKIK